MAQEYAALFETTNLRYRWKYIKQRERAGKTGGVKMERAALDRMMADAAYLRAHRADVYYVMVEPNPNLFAMPIYRRADLALNIALASNDQTCSLMPLFFANKDKTGQGSSLFAAKPNVDTGDYQHVLAVDAMHFATTLKGMFDSETGGDDYRVILRLNNEGAEVEVIKSFETVFGTRLSAVLGSLADVAKVKGAPELDALYAFMEGKGITFLPLSTTFATWPAAMALIREKVSGLLD
jgi:hypothetical protein